MSSVLHRFTLGGSTDTTLGIQLLKKYVEPIAPSVRNKTVRIPGRDGEYDFGGDFGPRDITLICAFVDALDREELQEHIRTLAGLFVGTDGKPCDLALTFDEKEAGKSYTVRYAGRQLNVDRILQTGYFKLALRAFDPFAYEAEETDVTAVATSPKEIPITNDGTVATSPTITITNNGAGTVTGFTIERK